MRAIGIVLAGGNSKRMRELSSKRAVAAMPVAGSYRSIDSVSYTHLDVYKRQPMEPAVPYHQPLLPTWQKALIWKPA